MNSSLGPRRLYIYLHNDVVTTSFVTDRHQATSRRRRLSSSSATSTSADVHSRRTRAGGRVFFFFLGDTVRFKICCNDTR